MASSPIDRPYVDLTRAAAIQATITLGQPDTLPWLVEDDGSAANELEPTHTAAINALAALTREPEDEETHRSIAGYYRRHEQNLTAELAAMTAELAERTEELAGARAVNRWLRDASNVRNLTAELETMAAELAHANARIATLLEVLRVTQPDAAPLAAPAAKVHTFPANALRHRTQRIGLLVR